jgi:HD superfamily phosphodiesterase
MTVPGRIEAAALLLSLDPPPWFLRHACAVAEIAGWLGARTAEAGVPVDPRLVESAALLHDVDKLIGPGEAGAGDPHGDGSAAWLAARGHDELGPAVAWHPVTRLSDGDAFAAWLATAGPEARIVAYADKRAGQRLESMDARFVAWERRYPPRDGVAGWDRVAIAAIRERAARLEADVCAAAATTAASVARLRWTGPALRRARRAAAASSARPAT